jgi:hypothetical protein
MVLRYAYSSYILNRRKNCLCQLLNVHVIKDTRQTAVHNAELLVTEYSPFEVNIYIEKPKQYKSQPSRLV